MSKAATLAERFRRFAERECAGRSPLYEALSRRIAEEDFLLGLAARSQPGQPPPNMLFAAVQACLLRQPDDLLAAFYPSLTAEPAPPEAAFPAFRGYCTAKEEEITRLLASRVVSTNEVQRCACLLPAVGLVAKPTITAVRLALPDCTDRQVRHCG